MVPVWTLALATLMTSMGDAPRVARVVADVVDVLDEPDDGAFSTARLVRGTRVTIRRDGPDGWVTIEPPDGSFSFIEDAMLEDLGDGRARVHVATAAVRPGREGARLPGPPRVTLRQGAIVQLLDRRPLVVRRRGTAETWIAIAPPAQEARFVRSEAVRETSAASDKESSPRRDRLAARRSDDEPPALDPGVSSKRLAPLDPVFLSVPPLDPTEGVSAEVADSLAKLGDRHRSELRKSIEKWNLRPIESAYEEILKGSTEQADRRAVERGLGILRKQARAAEAAARLAKLLGASRARDGQVDEVRRDSRAAGRAIEGDFDATGLLQTSSRLLEGRRVYALLGEDGTVSAYLALPPGLVIDPLLSHRVGVRGEGRFDEGLGKRLILVQDVERLEGESKRSSK
jgi:hypothetical protein